MAGGGGKKCTAIGVKIRLFWVVWYGYTAIKIWQHWFTHCLHVLRQLLIRVCAEQLSKRKLGVHFVPHSLTAEQEGECVVTCQDVLEMMQVQNDPELVNKTVTDDKLWLLCIQPGN